MPRPAAAQGGNATNYAYDSQNRLIQVSDKDNHPIARYGYDPFDRRIWKEAYRNKDGAPLSQPTRSYYLYADEGLIAESQQPITLPLPVGEGGGEGVTATTEPTITTQYGPRPDGEFTTATLFIKTKNSAGQNTIAYYHHDHLGTPIQATDRSGIIVWSAQYNAFGNGSITKPTATDDKTVIASNLRFPGQIENAETGLYYNWHRYYDPEIGRYVTADPIGLDGGINFYSYVGGNPVNKVDPFGLHDVSRPFPWPSEPVNPLQLCIDFPVLCVIVVNPIQVVIDNICKDAANDDTYCDLRFVRQMPSYDGKTFSCWYERKGTMFTFPQAVGYACPPINTKTCMVDTSYIMPPARY